MKVLVIEDVEDSLAELCEFIENRGHKCTPLKCGEDIDMVKDLQSHKLAIIDFKLGEERWTGLRTGYELKQKAPNMRLIMLTACYDNPQLRLAALNGAFDDFHLKANNNFDFLEQYLIKTKPATTSKKVKSEPVEYELIGESAVFKETLDIAERLARGGSFPIVLYGEPGTGKDEFARFIHYKSRRSNNDFVSVNCAAFASEDLLLSELFGHVAGAFSGAIGETTGCFESANDGTIFLDEFGDLSARAQGAILEVLQSGTFYKVGDKKNKITVSVRIVAATNKNIGDMVNKGLFRGDLYGRLGIGKIVLPSLRNRPDDIVILADNFIKSFQNSADGDRRPLTLSREAKDVLTNMSWSNNVRSLKATIELTCGMFNTDDRNEGRTIIEASDLCIAASEDTYVASNDSKAECVKSVDSSSLLGLLPAQMDLPNELTLRDISGLLDNIQLCQELDGTKPGDMILLENAYINLVKKIIDKAQDRKGSMIQALSFLAGEDLGELSYLSTAIHKRIESKLRLFEGLKTPESGRIPRGKAGNGNKGRASTTP